VVNKPVFSPVVLVFFAFLQANIAVCAPYGHNLPGRDTLRFDTGHPVVHRAEDNWREKYTGEDFQYEYHTSKETASLWERFKRWLSGKIMRWFELDTVNRANRWVDRLIKAMYVVVFAVVLYLFVRAFYKGEATRLFAPADTLLDLQAEELSGRVPERDYSTFISRAESDGHFREAVRFRYLDMLKHLHHAGIIEWSKHKTASDYKKEIPRGDKRKNFNLLTKIYLYYWYGKFVPRQDDYEVIKELFEEFQRNTGI